MKEFCTVVLYKNICASFWCSTVMREDDWDDDDISDALEDDICEPYNFEDGEEIYRGEDDDEAFNFFYNLKLPELHFKDFERVREEWEDEDRYQTEDAQMAVLYFHEVDDEGNDKVTIEEKMCSRFSSSSVYWKS